VCADKRRWVLEFQTPIPLIATRIAVFRLPAELIVEILSNFGDPHCNILRERSDRGSGILVVEHMERLTVIRKLTMTCWDLRNALFPLLWQYVEGCNVYLRSDPMAPSRNGLYDQCSYLAHNPTVGAHVQYVYSRISIRIKHLRCTGPFLRICGSRTPRRTYRRSSSTVWFGCPT